MAHSEQAQNVWAHEATSSVPIVLFCLNFGPQTEKESDTRHAYDISVGKLCGKRPTGGRRHRWKYNIKQIFGNWVSRM